MLPFGGAGGEFHTHTNTANPHPCKKTLFDLWGRLFLFFFVFPKENHIFAVIFSSVLQK